MKLSTSKRKKFRIRNKLKNVSTNDRYRLSVSRSLKNISAQIIDDIKNATMVSASSNEKIIKNLKKKKQNWIINCSSWILSKKSFRKKNYKSLFW